MTFLVGCGAGFSGDRVDAARPVVDELIQRGLPGALMFETLGERTLAAAHRVMADGSGSGYEPLLEQFLAPVIGPCIAHGIPVISNFGAANPAGAARAVARLAEAASYPDARIAVVAGDDIRDRLYTLDLQPWEAEREALPEPSALIAANVYLGARALVDALDAGADVVVAGRVADPALVLAPLVHHFGWRWDDWDRLAAGTLAGHLIECGSQVSGGYFADPGRKDIPQPADIGYPIVEVEADGRMVVTKPRDTGGIVSPQTVKEQLLYEVHDPAAYVTPDVVLDLSSVDVRQLGPDRVAVAHARGKPRPDRLKVTVSCAGGWLGEAEISYAGPNALARAELAASVLRERLAARDLRMRTRIDIIGYRSVFDDDGGQLALDASPAHRDLDDFRVRLAVEDRERDRVEAATQELLALYCSGPAGGGGVRRNHSARIHTHSYLVPRQAVTTTVTTLQGEQA